MPFCEIAIGRQSGDVVAVEQDAAGGRPQHAGQAIEERALARAVRPDDGADFAALHLEIDLVERRQSAEADGQHFGAQDRSRLRLPGSTPGRRSSVDACALTYEWRTCRPAGRSSSRLAIVSRMMVLAVLDLEDELADERLMVFLAETPCRPAGSRRPPSSPGLRAPRSASSCPCGPRTSISPCRP